MKLFLSFCLLSLLFLHPILGFSQKDNLKTVEISGTKYVLHTVKKSETVFSLCQKYKVTQEEIKLANPGIATILQAGTTVRIPVGKVVPEPKKAEAKPQPAVAEEYYYHKVNKKQTLFSIAKQYGITANDLIRNNPELSNGLLIGQVLKIPVSITNSNEQSGNESSADSGVRDNLSDNSVHQVVSGETLFSLEQKYGITHEEMLKNNPALRNGLKAGMKLKIPAKDFSRSVETKSIPQSFTSYQVQKGETIFSLSARFGIDVVELKKANPSLFSRSLEIGETILIPQQISKKNDASPMQTNEPVSALVADSPSPSNCQPLTGNNKKYKAALLLPLNLPGNENVDPVSIDKALLLSKISFSKQTIPINSDTTIIINGVNIDQKTEGFLEFYEGTLLAIDSLQRKGMDIELYVFDASNQSMINALLQLDEFRDLNLIIGPVYPELQETVASFAAKNRIPMVSPLSSTGNFELNNSWYFKVNPTREFQLEQTASYIANEFSNKNFILLQVSGNSSSADAQLAILSKEKLMGQSGKNHFHEYNFQQQGVNGIKTLLDETGENIFIIPTDNEAQVSVAVTNLTALAEHYDIVLMGTSALTKLKSKQTENYHRIRLRYLSPYFTDYTKPLVRRFVGEYRNTFAAEPSQFSFQGFDVSYYFLSALYSFGKNFRNCLPEYPMELTQMNFSFRKVAPMGGFMNQSLFVTAYERNFDVLNYGTVNGNSRNK
ncbi:MAG: LysM peptidoglycan-binding domain-containing protein [Bacteroidota bacterium]|nr:LysM peptidoglycan-binding domain-containing protein [Bacteroidota bacterium]